MLVRVCCVQHQGNPSRGAEWTIRQAIKKEKM